MVRVVHGCLPEDCLGEPLLIEASAKFIGECRRYGRGEAFAEED